MYWCPDLKLLNDIYYLENGFTSANSVSLAIELIKCVPELNSFCKNDDEIESLLNKMYITF